MKTLNLGLAALLGAVALGLVACNNGGGSSPAPVPSCSSGQILVNNSCVTANCTVPGTGQLGYNNGYTCVAGSGSSIYNNSYLGGTIACTTTNGVIGVRTISGNCGTVISQGGYCTALIPYSGQVEACAMNNGINNGIGGWNNGWNGGGTVIVQPQPAPWWYYRGGQHHHHRWH